MDKTKEANGLLLEKFLAKKEEDRKRLEELRRIYEAEMEESRGEEERIRKVFEERERVILDEKNKEKFVRNIQHYFEDWYKEVGQFMKIKKGKKK